MTTAVEEDVIDLLEMYEREGMKVFPADENDPDSGLYRFKVQSITVDGIPSKRNTDSGSNLIASYKSITMDTGWPMHFHSDRENDGSVFDDVEPFKYSDEKWIY